MRRVIILICLVAVLACMAVPAFAASQSGSSDSVVYTNLCFDTIKFDSSSSSGEVSYPFNSCLLGGSGDFSFDDGALGYGSSSFIQSSSSSAGIGYIDGEFFSPFGSPSIGKTSQMTLSAGPQFVSSSAISSYRVSFPEYVLIESYTINLQVCYLDYDDQGALSLVTRSVSKETVLSDDGVGATITLGSRIASLANSLGAVHTTPMFLRSIDIVFNYQRLTVETFSFDVYSPTAGASSSHGSAYARLWVEVQKIQASGEVGEPVNFGQWITDSVSSLLNMEIFPGFSISTIFYLILVVSVVFFIIRMLT